MVYKKILVETIITLFVDKSEVRCFFSTWGRVWAHHLNLSSGHRWNSNGQWLCCPVPWFIKTGNSVYPEFFPSTHLHSFTYMSTNKKNWVGHHWNGNMQWPELKLRWWTQTLPQLYRIYEVSALPAGCFNTKPPRSCRGSVLLVNVEKPSVSVAEAESDSWQ